MLDFLDISSAKNKGLSILVVITAYNVERFLPKLLDSLAGQTESDWRVVFVDDASTDSTFTRLSELLEQYQVSNRFTLIRNNERQYKARNIYNVLRRFGGINDIVVLHDGDDWLCDAHSLERLRLEHEKGWEVVWSDWRGSDGTSGNSYHLNPWLPPRVQPWVSSHLFSFRKSLFDAVEAIDLQNITGEWVREACDRAIAWPLLEQTIRRKHIREVLYIYNRHNPLNNDKLGHRWRNNSSLAQASSAARLRWRSTKPVDFDVRFVISHTGEFVRATVLNLLLVRRYWWVLIDAWHFRGQE